MQLVTYESFQSSNKCMNMESIENESQTVENDNEELNMFYESKTNNEKETKYKSESLIYMTKYFYKTSTTTNTQTQTKKIGEAIDSDSAKSMIHAKKCEASYKNFMSEIEILKTKYESKSSDDWSTNANNYNDVRKELVQKSSLYYQASKRAFMYANNFDLCEKSVNINNSLLVSKLYVIIICFNRYY